MVKTFVLKIMERIESEEDLNEIVDLNYEKKLAI